MSDKSPHHLLRLGVVGRSTMENEHRLPLHPAHLPRIDADLRAAMLLEEGYGEPFGIPDHELAPLVGEICSRAALLEAADVVLLPKPQHEDFNALRTGQVLWGWPHCVQDPVATQVAIDQSLTLIAFEAMNYWDSRGGFGLHVFHKNNELAGFASVLHALALVGTTGTYGRPLRAVVIGFGATARGAITALNAHGIHDVQVLTNRQVGAVGSPIHSVRISHFAHASAAPHETLVSTPAGPVPVADVLAASDVVVNCTFQDTDHPLTYLDESDLPAFRRGSLIVDVSCDEGMGFSWARPTTFDEPMFTVGDGIGYYAVDHTPSYLWASATWELSEALMPFLRTVMSGPQAWDTDQTVTRAIEVRDGVVVNPAILSFQGRAAEHPHPVTTGATPPQEGPGSPTAAAAGSSSPR
ncbi:MAG: N(5)-(carboxyethyl)ornithine synthase [Nocardioides sp.]|nr:N(5)-(carboxyethyl)ornithine synthase [Nocardioides sp.]